MTGASDIIIARNPATLEELGRVSVATPDDVLSAVDRSKRAFPNWAKVPIRERGRYLLRARHYLLQHMDDIALTITQENGKPLVEAITAELYPLADLLRYFGREAAHLLRPERLSTGMVSLMGRKSVLQYQPLGVVGVISPWNYPFSIPAGAIAMALVAGNTVLLKPSPAAVLVASQVEKMFAAAGLPEDVFINLPGDDHTGAMLVQAPVNQITFTGSVSAGKQIQAACAERLTPCTLELGGKDPMIVRADANIDVASSGAVWGAFTNAGQCCASVERVYVHSSIAEQFLDQVISKTRLLRQGVGTNPNVDIGPLTLESQLEIVRQQVDDARSRGAKVLIGGERNAAFAGYFYLPTVLSGVTHECAVMREETFGPVMPIMQFTDDDEAIALANDTQFGLSASIWSSDSARANEMAQRIRAGTVTVNDCLYTHAICQTPWGGPGESGSGRTHGRMGLLNMVEPLHIHTNHRAELKDPWWYPYDHKLYQLFRKLTRRTTNGFWRSLTALPVLLNSLKIKKR